MEYEVLKMHIYDMNEDEQFYKKYYFARQQKYSLEKFLSNIDKTEIIKRRLLVYEYPETIPEKMLDSYVFDLSDTSSITVLKHNRYSPPITHKHTFFELEYIFSGKCIQNISGEKIELHSGDVFIIPPGVEHSVETNNDELIMFNVLIRKDTLHTLFYNFLNAKNVLSAFFMENLYAAHPNDYILFRSGMDMELREAFLRLYWEFQNKEKYYFEAIASTLQLNFYLLVRNYGESVEKSQKYSKSDAQRYGIIQYMRTNFKEITLGELSDKFNFSEEYISKMIKEASGMTYTKLLQKIRIENACDYLVNTNMSIIDIGLLLGYKNNEHFMRQFKNYMEMTPGEYRKLYSPK